MNQTYRTTFCSLLYLENLAFTIGHESLGLDVRKYLVDKIQIDGLVERATEEVATQVDLQQTNGMLLVSREDDIPTRERNLGTELEVTFLDQLEHGVHVRHVIARDHNVPVRMRRVAVRGSPGASPGQNLRETQPIPVRVGRSTPNETRVDIDIKENRIVIRRRTSPTRPKDTREGPDVLGIRLLANTPPTARNDPKGRERRRGRQERRHPIAVLNPLLNDPVPTVGRIPKEMNAHAAFFVAVLEDQRRCGQKRRHGHAAMGALLEKGPLVLHLIVVGHVIQQGVQSDDVAIEPPVTEPVVGGQETSGEFVTDAGALLPPLLQGCHETDFGINKGQEPERSQTTAGDDRQGNAGSWNGNVAEVVEQVVAVGALAVVRLAVEIEVGGQTEEMDVGVLEEELAVLRVGLLGLEKGSVVRVTPRTDPVVVKAAIKGPRVLGELVRQRNDLSHGVVVV